MKFFENFDWPILICILLLFGLGASVIASVAPDVMLTQIIFFALGLVIFFALSNLDYRIISSFSRLLYIFGIACLLLTLFIGLESRGSVRWIAIGSFRLQFSEILKPIFVLTQAVFFSSKNSNYKHFLTNLLLCFIPAILVFRQPDLGSALVYSGGFLIMLFLAGTNVFYFLSLAIPSLGSMPIIWHFLADYQKKRILTFLSPGADPLGASYNAIQSVITVGSGMFFGRGLGRGTQSHLAFLPEHHTDFIFASIAEEFGFLGSVFVLTCYLILIWRTFKIAEKCEDRTGSLIAVGVGSFLLVQVVINVGMNVGLLPITGITLPLISYGGSSLLATMIGLGLVENISKSIGEKDGIRIR